jgi:hypothetical protein
MSGADKQTPIYPPAPRAWTKGPKRPRGRPTKRSKERDDGIIRAILVGFNLKAVAAANCITYQTLRTWIKEDASFGRSVEQARANAEQARIATIKRAQHKRQQQPTTTTQTTEKAYYDAYIEELHRILDARRKQDDRERLNAALTRHGLDPFPPDS